MFFFLHLFKFYVNRFTIIYTTGLVSSTLILLIEYSISLHAATPTDERCSARPHIFESDDDRREFTEFIEKLSNTTFENYDQLPMNRTFDIDSNQYMDLLWNFSFVFKPELNNGGSAHKLYLQDTITELGICYAVNSKIAVYNSYR